VGSRIPARDLFPVDGVAEGTDVLVAGPSAEAVRGIPESILESAGGVRDGALAVTTRGPGEVVAEKLAAIDCFDGDLVGVVDCSPHGDPPVDDWRPLYQRVSSPGDLTGGSMAVVDSLETLGERGADRVHLLYDSLSTVFISSSTSAAVRYVHQVTLQRGYPRGVGVYPVYTDVTTDRDLERLKHFADALVEVRIRGRARQVRCRGIDAGPGTWTTMDAPVGERVRSGSD